MVMLSADERRIHMTSEDKYLLGILWKFGSIKYGTGQFSFESYDKLEHMEYIRKMIAPDSKIREYSRINPNDKSKTNTTYKLRFTNNDWAHKVNSYKGINAEKIIDVNFLRGFLEIRSSISKCGNCKKFNIPAKIDELDMISSSISKYFDVGVATPYKVNDDRGFIAYGVKEATIIFKTLAKYNKPYWESMINKINGG